MSSAATLVPIKETPLARQHHPPLNRVQVPPHSDIPVFVMTLVQVYKTCGFDYL